jgi:hypothetical protein
MLPKKRLQHACGTLYYYLPHLRKDHLNVYSQQTLLCAVFSVTVHSQCEALHVAFYYYYTDPPVAACFVLDFHRHTSPHAAQQAEVRLQLVQASLNL